VAVETSKSITYHIPKTGGSWVRVAIRNSGLVYNRSKRYGMTHPSCWHTEHSTPNDAINFKGLFSSCFVRHPIEWHKSFWCYIYRRRSKVKSQQTLVDDKAYALYMHNSRDPIEQCWEQSYEKYLINVIERFPSGFLNKLYMQFTPFVDFVGRQENLVDDLIYALNFAGENFDEYAIIDTKPINITKKLKKLCVTSKKLEDKILETESRIIKKFYAS